MKLGGMEVLEAKRARNNSTQGCDSLSPHTSDQMIHEIVELEDLIGLSRKVRPLRDRK
jgi:hypothetical protein